MFNNNSLVRWLDKVEIPYYTTLKEGCSQGDRTALLITTEGLYWIKNETTEGKRDKVTE